MVVTTYASLLARMPPWDRFEMRCFSAYITVEAYLMPKRSVARAMKLARGR